MNVILVSFVFFNFEQILHIALLFPLLTLNKLMLAGNVPSQH